MVILLDSVSACVKIVSSEAAGPPGAMYVHMVGRCMLSVCHLAGRGGAGLREKQASECAESRTAAPPT